MRSETEMENKYTKLLTFLNSVDQFIWVYRAEGDKNLQSGNKYNPQLQGSWYTESWAQIQGTHKPKLKTKMNGKEPKIYALLIPKIMLDSRTILQKGNQELNIINPELSEGRIELTDSVNLIKNNFPKATRETYLNQFKFVKEYSEMVKIENNH